MFDQEANIWYSKLYYCGATVLTLNNSQVPGSSTLDRAPESNHIYTISNTVLVHVHSGDKLSLLFWTDDVGAYIGEPYTLSSAATIPAIGSTGPDPPMSVAEATASLVITAITVD